MTAFEKAIYDILTKLHGYTRNYVRTVVIAGMLATNERIVRRVLVRLECRGIIERKGIRGGWKPRHIRKPIQFPQWQSRAS